MSAFAGGVVQPCFKPAPKKLTHDVAAAGLITNGRYHVPSSSSLGTASSAGCPAYPPPHQPAARAAGPIHPPHRGLRTAFSTNTHRLNANLSMASCGGAEPQANPQEDQCFEPGSVAAFPQAFRQHASWATSRLSFLHADATRVQLDEQGHLSPGENFPIYRVLKALKSGP